jgi:RNA polymerase sigma-70 factor (ECF subfamily)
MVAFDEEAHEPAKETSTPESLLIEHADREMVQKALADLPVHFREILLLCEVEDMSYQEIAETLSIPQGTVMSRLSRARKTLRELLRQRLQGGSHGV